MCKLELNLLYSQNEGLKKQNKELQKEINRLKIKLKEKDEECLKTKKNLIDK